MKLVRNLPLEALIWTGALILLFIWQPGEGNHVSLCPLSLTGFEHCPGCGIGRSISLAMHGDLAGSWSYHFFGIPGLVIIVYRIYQLFKTYIKEYGKGDRITSRA